MMKKKLLFTLLCILTIVGNTLQAQTNYYVSNSGDDNNNGTSPTTAWQTISKVNAQNYLPGDSILFKRGDTWQSAEIDATSHGTVENSICYGAYGSGERPSILGSAAIIQWKQTSTNIWESIEDVPKDTWHEGRDSCEVFFEHISGEVSWGDHQETISGLVEEFDWTFLNNKIYIYSNQNPTDLYSAVQAPQVREVFHIRDKNYIAIDNLAIKYVLDIAVYDEYGYQEVHGLRVTNCHIGWVGAKEAAVSYGIGIHNCDAYIGYNIIENIGRRNISLGLNNRPEIPYENVLIEHNHMKDGFHTTGLDIISGGTIHIKNVTFRYNLVEISEDIDLAKDNNGPSNLIYMSATPSLGGGVSDIYIYGNVFKHPTVSSIKFNNVESIHIYNNTFYNFNSTITKWQSHLWIGKGNKDINVHNNIFHNDAGGSILSSVSTFSDILPELKMDNNLFSDDGSGSYFFVLHGEKNYGVADWESYKSDTGFGDNDPKPADPLFTDPANDNWALKENSPAIGNAMPVSWITSDFVGNERSTTKPTIGAVEYEYEDKSEALIGYFNIPNQISNNIDRDNKTVSIIMPYSADISNLTPSIGWSKGAQISPLSGVAQDFSSDVQYTVTSEDNSTLNTYVISVERAHICDGVELQIEEDIKFASSLYNNGEILLETTMGTTPYSYSWDNGETTNKISGLSSGTYDVTVTDKNGCNATASYEVKEMLDYVRSGVYVDSLYINMTNIAQLESNWYNITEGNKTYELKSGIELTTNSVNAGWTYYLTGVDGWPANVVNQYRTTWGTNSNTVISKLDNNYYYDVDVIGFYNKEGAYPETTTVNGLKQDRDIADPSKRRAIYYNLELTDGTINIDAYRVCAIIIRMKEKPTGNLSDQALIEKFNIPGELSSTINNNMIDIVMPLGTNLTELTPNITTSSNATITPSSDVAQNFTTDVKYTVVSENLLNMTKWTVSVKLDNGTEVGSSYVNNKEFVIFPNPATDYFTTNNITRSKTLKLYNTQGTLLKQWIKPSENYFVGDLSTGVYMIVIETTNKKHTLKFIKK